MMDKDQEHLRMVEALLFATTEPLSVAEITSALPEGADVEGYLAALKTHYEGRGVQLSEAGGRWFFRTAADLSFLLRKEVESQRKLSRAGVETLAIIAYHQPVTRAEIEEIRGVQVSKGTLDVLMEAGWVRPKGRRQSPGKPVTYGTSDDFLVHFGLENLDDLPGFDELKAAGLLDSVDKALNQMEKESAEKEKQAAAREAQAMAEEENPEVEDVTEDVAEDAAEEAGAS
ncbi:MAG: SMC-Scp complex subunit ScpB [Sphingomonadales bacterium]